MKFFKSYSISSLLLRSFMRSFAMVVLFTGCFRPQARDMNAEGQDEEAKKTAASFELGEIKGGVAQAAMIPGFSIPQSKLYNYSLCLKDRRTQEAIRGHSFAISGGGPGSGGETEWTVKTDVSGCLNWSETVEFNFFSSEKFLPLRRLITAKSPGDAGAREIRFAINPWNFNGQSATVVDLTLKSDAIPTEQLATEAEVAELLRGESTTGGHGNSGSLYHKSLVIQPWISPTTTSNGKNPKHEKESEKGKNRTVQRSLILRLKPGVVVRDLQNQPFVYPLTEARLNMKIGVVTSVQSGGATKDYLLPAAAGEKGVTTVEFKREREGDLFRAEIPVDLSQVSLNGSMRLALRLMPVNGPSGLRPLDALIDIGRGSDVVATGAAGRSLPTTVMFSSVEGSFALDEYLQSLQSPLGETSRSREGISPSNTAPSSGAAGPVGSGESQRVQPPSGISQLQEFVIDNLKMNYLGVVTGSETATRRTIFYEIKVCVKDSSGQSLADVDFTVKVGEGATTKEFRTSNKGDMLGCFKIEERLPHKFYEKEGHVLIPVTIRHASGFVEKRTIAINPAGNSPWGFGVDTLENPNSLQPISATGGSSVTGSIRDDRSRILVDSVMFDSLETRYYEIDQFLRQRTVKLVRIRIPLRVKRASLMVGESRPAEPLRDGIYLFKAALYVEIQDPTGQSIQLIEPMKGQSRLARVRGGELKIDAELPIEDVRLIRSRASLVFKILPIDEIRLSQELSTAEIEALEISGGRSPDIYEDETTGLVTPTFVGPLWIRDEAGAFGVMPSEDLAVNTNPKSGDEEQKRSSLRPLAKIEVEKLFALKAEADQAATARLREDAALASLLKRGNLEYVALANENAILVTDPRIAANNRALPRNGTLEHVLKSLNEPYTAGVRGLGAAGTNFGQLPLKEPVTAATLRDLVRGRMEIDTALATRFCALMLGEVFERLSPGGRFVTTRSRRPTLFVEDCIRNVKRSKADDVFVVDRKLLVRESGPATRGIGKQLSLIIGTDASFNRTTSVSENWSYGWSPTGLLDAIGKIPGLGAVNIFNLPGLLGISVTANRTDSKSATAFESAGLNSGTSLNVEQLEMDLTFKRYEACAAVRVNPLYWNARKKSLSFINEAIRPEEKMAILNRGIFFCEGEEETKPVSLKERYYTIAQGVFDSTLLDGGDVNNHPWLLALRGDRDFAHFIGVLAVKKTSAADVTEKVELADFALDRLQQAYSGILPTFPGVYTINSRRAGFRLETPPTDGQPGSSEDVTADCGVIRRLLKLCNVGVK